MVEFGQFIEEVASLLVILGNGNRRGSKEAVVGGLKVSDVADAGLDGPQRDGPSQFASIKGDPLSFTEDPLDLILGPALGQGVDRPVARRARQKRVDVAGARLGDP